MTAGVTAAERERRVGAVRGARGGERGWYAAGVDETFAFIVGRLAATSTEALTRFLDRELDVEHLPEALWQPLFDAHLAAGLAVPARFAVGDVVGQLAPVRDGATLWFGADASALGRVAPLLVCELAEHAVGAGLDAELALLGRTVLDEQTSVHLRAGPGHLVPAAVPVDGLIAAAGALRADGAAAALAVAAGFAGVDADAGGLGEAP